MKRERGTMSDEVNASLHRSSLIAQRESFDAELARQTLRAPVHHSVVVPLEDGPRDGREQVHPRLGRTHVPVVAYAYRVAFVGEVPDARPGKFADGFALDERHRFDARKAH